MPGPGFFALEPIVRNTVRVDALLAWLRRPYRSHRFQIPSWSGPTLPCRQLYDSAAGLGFPRT